MIVFGKRAILVWVGLAGVFICGCATPYRPMKSGTGFADRQIGSNEFVVHFQGNSNTKATQANDFALLRAAQVALDHGFSYFAITDITNTSSARPYLMRQQIATDYPPNMGVPPPTPFAVQEYQFGYIAQYEQPGIYFRPGERLWIKCFKTKPARPFTYNAAALAQSLKQKYRLS